MKKASELLFYTFCIILLLSCGRTERVNTEQVKDALKRREIKKISDAEILEAGLKKGKLIADTLVTCYNQTSKPFHYKTCLDSAQIVVIDTVIIVYPGSSKDMTAVEKDLMDAYQYNFSQNQQLLPNLQDLKNGKFLYTYPVFTNSNRSDFQIVPGEKSSTSFAILFLYLKRKQLVLQL